MEKTPLPVSLQLSSVKTMMGLSVPNAKMDTDYHNYLIKLVFQLNSTARPMRMTFANNVFLHTEFLKQSREIVSLKFRTVTTTLQTVALGVTAHTDYQICRTMFAFLKLKIAKFTKEIFVKDVSMDI